MAVEPDSDRFDIAADEAKREDAPPAPPEPRSRTALTTAVRYGAMNWVGEFVYRSGALTRCGSPVVIQTDRGIELGQHVELCCPNLPQAPKPEQIRRYVENSGQEFYRSSAGRILREATRQDMDEHQRLNAHVQDDINQCATLARELRLDIKLVTAEHLLGGERIVIYFQAEGRIDFRDLVKELARRYRTRIEMRQVGARDEARLVADWEVCGRECCCKNFLKSLRPVNMKMAKIQKSTLDPSKVSGRCGRLRCCLRYEHEGYQELAAKLPRKGSRVATLRGEGTVIDGQVLTQLVMVRGDDERDFSVPLDEITAFDLPKPPPRELPRPDGTPEPAGAPGGDRFDRSRRRGQRPRPDLADQGGKPRTAPTQRPAARDDSTGARTFSREPSSPPETVQPAAKESRPAPQPKPEEPEVRPAPDAPQVMPPQTDGATPAGEGDPTRPRGRRRRRRHRSGPGGTGTPPESGAAT
jgi:cell fate regulator YaaT (PSP1 superfamily)